MNKEYMFIARDETGKEVEYEMLLVKNVDDKSVIWYTDGTSDEDGRKNIYISEYDRQGNTFMLNPINDEALIEKYADIFSKEFDK